MDKGSDKLVKSGGCLVSAIAIIGGAFSFATPNEAENLRAPYIVAFGVMVMFLVISYNAIPFAKLILTIIVGALLILYILSNLS